MLDAGLERVAVFGFFDPDVVEQMAAAGVGASVTVELGGKLPMPALTEQSRPVTLTGEVKLISNGSSCSGCHGQRADHEHGKVCGA